MLRTILKSLSKKTKILMAAAALTGVAIAVPAAVFAGFGPNGSMRPIYDFSNPAQREGPTDGPHFNSYINTNVYGDERAFLDAKACTAAGDACYSQGVSGGFKDKVDVTPGQEYIVRAYVHNDANPSTNGTNNDGIGVAKDTKFRVEIPKGIANGFTLNGTISASNAIPKEVYDTVDLLNGSKAFNVEYETGSARIFNASHPNGFALSDNIVTTGAPLGANEMNGVFPGCFEFSAFVTIRVKITSPNLKITKRVTTPGSTDWKESLDVKTGDTVSWLINYDITDATANDVTIRDVMPKGVTLVPGTITWFDPNHPNGEALADTVLGAGGVNVGNYQAGSGGAIRFRTTVDKEVPACEAVNIAFGRASNIPEQSDTAKVVITNCKPKTPSFSCDLLTKQQVGDDKSTFKFTVNASATNGATIKSYTFDFGDKTTPLTTDQTTTPPHTYTPGSYIAKVTVNARVNNQDQTANGTQCTVPITVGSTPSNGKLTDTGAGDIFGIFSGTTLGAALLHRKWMLRRR